jgi:NAD(P)-dependent dehydrogenase (short-subunit alcohol dehydrogenase family)
MAKILITGSTDGLGLLAAKALLQQGHELYLHARNKARKEELLKNNLAFKEVFVADFNDVQQTITLAKEVNAVGKFDVIIHNAGVYSASGETIFTVNVLAPYILSCLIEKPKRLIYVSSDMHLGGQAKLETIKNSLNNISYSDSKLHVLMLCKAIARAWPNVYTNALHPGWVPTKMGGKGAPDNLEKGYETQVWLAVSNEEEALVNGKYFFHKKQKHYHPKADDFNQQDELIRICEASTGVAFKKLII